MRHTAPIRQPLGRHCAGSCGMADKYDEWVVRGTVDEGGQAVVFLVRTIIFWGQNDIFFTREGGEAYLNELPKAEMHRLDSGHFAVEDCLDYIVTHVHRFYRDVVAPGRLTA